MGGYRLVHKHVVSRPLSWKRGGFLQGSQVVERGSRQGAVLGLRQVARSPEASQTLAMVENDAASSIVAAGNRVKTGQGKPVLAHPRRRGILAQIARVPGIQRRGLQAETLRGGGLGYHLGRLRRDGLISITAKGYQVTAEGARGLERLRLMESSTARSLLVALERRSNERTMEQLAKQVGANLVTTTHYVRRLGRLGLVIAWQGGKANFAICTGEGRRYAAWIRSMPGQERGRSFAFAP